jgi:integrase
LPAVAEEAKAGFAGLTAATVNRRLAILRRVGNLASETWDWIDEPIGRRVKLLPEHNQRHIYLTLDQVEGLANACTSAHAADLIRLAAYTGIRYSHMLRLTSAAVRGDSIVLDTSSKNGRPLLLPLHPRVQDIAERLPLPILPLDLRRQWEAAREANGLPFVRWHDLRHTCASWLVQAGVPIVVVKELLNHKTIATTMRYAHLANENLRDAVRRIA